MKRAHVGLHDHVAIAGVPRRQRVARDGVHLDVDGEQVGAALGAMLEHLGEVVDEALRADALDAHPVGVAEGRADGLARCRPRAADLEQREGRIIRQGNKNKQMALERLYKGKDAKYTEQEVNEALRINATFDDIVKDMEVEG